MYNLAGAPGIKLTRLSDAAFEDGKAPVGAIAWAGLLPPAPWRRGSSTMMSKSSARSSWRLLYCKVKNSRGITIENVCTRTRLALSICGEISDKKFDNLH